MPSGALPHGALAAPFFASLRDPAVLALPPGALSSLTRRTPDGEEQTVRLGGEGAWFSAKPPAVADRAAAEALSGLLTNLVSSGAATLFTPDSAAYGLLPPRLEIVASTTLTNRPVVILQLGYLAYRLSVLAHKLRHAMSLAARVNVASENKGQIAQLV